MEERSSFAQDKFAALDTVLTPDEDLVVEEEEAIPGFGQDSD
jgi:hypothetical protein